MIDKNKTKALKQFTAKNHYRPELGCVSVKDNVAVATDSYILMKTSIPEPEHIPNGLYNVQADGTLKRSNIATPYPNVENIFPDPSKALASVTVNAKLLAKVAQAMKHAGEKPLHTVTINFYGDHGPLVFASPETTCLLMPVIT